MLDGHPVLRLIKRVLGLAPEASEPNPLNAAVQTLPPANMTAEEAARFHRFHSSNQYGR